MDLAVNTVAILVLLCHAVSSVRSDNKVELDLKLGIVNGYSPFITFIQSPTKSNNAKCVVQSVLKMDFSGKYKAAKFRLFYGQKPRSYTFHLSGTKYGLGNGGKMTSSHAPKNRPSYKTARTRLRKKSSRRSKSRSMYRNGKSGSRKKDRISSKDTKRRLQLSDDKSGSSQRNNAEIRIHNKQLRIYGNSALGLLEKTNSGRLLLKGINKFVQKSVVELNISDETLRWNNKGKNRFMHSEFLFTMYDHKTDRPYLSKRSDIVYAGFNRVVGGNFRSGSGLCRVEITLYRDTDSNSCASDKTRCHTNAICAPTRRSFACKCKPGYYGTGIRCKEHDECRTMNRGGCVHYCINTPGNYTCSCKPGFEISPDGHDCRDINECLEKRGGCEHQCRNNMGSHECLCNAGFSIQRDGRSCKEDAWCRRPLGCEQHCIKSSRGVRCGCRTGFILHYDGKKCTRTCLVGNGGCQHGCSNTVDKVTCSCKDGYRLLPDNSSCIALCGINRGGCSKRCRDTPKGPLCSCPSGYKLHQDGRTCLDIDECAKNNGRCSHTCVNRKGGYDCVCPSGYGVRDSDKKCVDIDECVVSSPCDHMCVNTPGNYRCECRRGYQIYGSTHCADKNECSDNNGGCRFTCRNTVGGYECPCPRGYRQHPNKKDCDKAEKCLPLKSPAKAELTCTRVRGTETCHLACKKGAQFTEYTQNSFTYTCGKQTQYIWSGEWADGVLPSCSITVTPPDMKRKATFYFKTKHCAMHDKTKSLFSRSLINNILDRKRYPCTGSCRLKDIKVKCKEMRHRSSRNMRDGIQRRPRHLQNKVTAEFELEVMPQSATANCNVECMKRKAKRKMKKTIRRMRRHIRKNDFLISWDNTRLRVDRRSFKAARIKLSCKPGQVLVKDKCVSCSIGMYYNTRKGKCEACPSGTYQSREGQTACAPCPNQKAASGIVGAKDRADCQALCMPGYYSEDGHKPCVPCAKGYYQPDYGRTSCIMCGERIHTSGLASTGFHQCIVRDFCNKGHFYNHESHSCKLCDKGKYQPKRGQNFCISCPGNTTTDYSGSINSSQCKAQKCGGRIGKYQGYIESPNYPGEFPANVDCRWYIRAQKHRRILVVVPEIFLPAGDKCGDELSMRKTLSPYSLTSYEVCTTIVRPYAFTASSRNLWVRFRSNAHNSSTGFSIPYVTYNKEYQGLIEDIVGDQRVYMSHQHQQILKDRKLLSALLEVIAVPHKYYKYVNVSNAVLPKSFTRLLRAKITRFLS